VDIEQAITPAAAPAVRLYKISGIALATAFGSVLAGGLLMFLNYRMLGLRRQATRALQYSALAIVVILGIALLIPTGWKVPNVVFTIPQLVVMTVLALQFQGDAIKAHRNGAGQMASNWRALGISLLVMVVVLASLFLTGMAIELLSPGSLPG
jgi:hypothetical protein